ncbi:MAG: hypothetical protein AB1765_04705 [Candidatus Hydrogenedentota bacterium]
MRKRESKKIKKLKQIATELIYEDEAFIEILRLRIKDEDKIREILKDLLKKAIRLVYKARGLSNKEAYNFLYRKIKRLKERVILKLT